MVIPQALVIKLAAEIILPVAEKIVADTENPYDDALIKGIEFIAGVDPAEVPEHK